MGTLPTFTGETGEGINPRLFTEPGQPQSDVVALPTYRVTADATDMQKRLEAYDAQANSFLPKLLGILAAAKGDFRILGQLEEQKRKTELAKAIFPDMIKLRNMQNQGDFEGAIAHAEQLSAAASARSPELKDVLNDVVKRIGDKQEALVGQKQTIATMDALNEEWKSKHDGQDMPGYSFIPAVKESLKANQPIPKDMMSKILERTKPHIAQMGGNIVVESGGNYSIEPMPEALPLKQVETPMALIVANAAGVSQDQLLSIMRGVPAKKVDGTVIQPGSPEAVRIRQAYLSTLPTTAQIEIGQQAGQIDPGALAGYYAAGGSALNAARRDFGGTLDRAMQIDALRKGQIARMTGQAATETQLASPYGAAGVGLTAINSRTGEVQYDMSSNQSKSLGPDWKLIPRENARNATHIHSSMQTLSDMNDLLKSLGDIKSGDTIGRLEKGVNDRIAALTGMTFDPKTVKRDAAAALINNSIESAVRGIPDTDKRNAEAGYLKTYMAGRLSSTKDMLEGMKIVQERLFRMMMGEIGVAPAKGPEDIVEGARKAVGKAITPESPTSVMSKGKPLPKGAALQQRVNEILNPPAESATPIPQEPVSTPTATTPTGKPAVVIKKGTLR